MAVSDKAEVQVLTAHALPGYPRALFQSWTLRRIHAFSLLLYWCFEQFVDLFKHFWEAGGIAPACLGDIRPATAAAANRHCEHLRKLPCMIHLFYQICSYRYGQLRTIVDDCSEHDNA